jgi:flagellar M-ring protein FliF
MEMWQGFTAQAKIGISFGLLCILGSALGLGIWAYRADYQVLFADLSATDAGAMVSELDKMKTPYRLVDDGRTILVAKDIVYKTRLKVMGTELPLHGAVGFEVFNNADFGMTEFVQKVNYQRAIQGELTRTIMSIDDVQSARVHLAIPEQGLFKKSLTTSKASVTLVMKAGRVLAPEQISGIQRLIAASVPDIVAADVTLLDQHGVTLTHMASADGGIESAMGQLDSKRNTEDYLLKKVTQVLDSTFGLGVAIASVDVVLNMDQDRVTTEDVLPAKGSSADGAPTGVVVRERQTTREAANGGASASAHDGAGGGSNMVESDYQVGKRIQQVVTAPGATRRMTIAVVVKRDLDQAQMEKLKEVVSLAIGLNAQRGDAIVVQSMTQLFSGAGPSAMVPTMQSATSNQLASPMAMPRRERGEMNIPLVWVLVPLGALVLFGLLGLSWFIAVRRADRQRFALPMSQTERDRLLQDVRLWIQHGVVNDALGGPK